MNSGSQNQPPPAPAVIPPEGHACTTCGAISIKEARYCWMCGQNPRDNPHSAYAPPIVAPPIEYAGSTPIPPPVASGRFEILFRVLLAICAVLAILIGIGMAAQDPGALLGYLILVGPAFLVTGVRAIWQFSSQGKANAGSLLLSLVVTFMVTIGALTLLVAASIILAFVICFEACMQMGR